MIWFLFMALVAFFAWYTISPFLDKNLRDRRIPSEKGELENLIVRKEEVLSAINDLEYDFHMKKIGEPDYLQLKEKLESEAVQLMMKIDELEGKRKQDAVSISAADSKAGKLHS